MRLPSESFGGKKISGFSAFSQLERKPEDTF